MACRTWVAVFLSVLTATVQTIGAASILGIAFTGSASHHMNVLQVGKELARRGHDFTFLVSDGDTLSTEPILSQTGPNLRIVDFKGSPVVGSEPWMATLSRDPQEQIKQLLNGQDETARYLYNDTATLQHLRKQNFDVLLRDHVTWPAAMLEDLLEVPSVGIVPLPLSIYADFVISPVPRALAYSPVFGLHYTCIMNFWQRVHNFLQHTLITLGSTIMAKSINAFVKESGLSFKEHETGHSTCAAIVVVSDWALDYPRPIPPKVHMVGPLLTSDAKPLPAELNNFLDKGFEDDMGAVYVSFGTFARLTKPELHSVSQALTALPNPVLWKLDPKHLPVNVSIASLGLGSNIKLISWAPQNDVLGHPAVKVFVTQAGINSLYEAAYHAKPLVSVPLTADQPVNAGKAVYHGFGLTVPPSKLVPVNGKPLLEAIQQVLANSTYKANAVKVQRRLLNKPRSGAELAGDVVERVIATGGERYLDTREQELTWWQLSLLDVKVFLAAVALLLLSMLFMLCWWAVLAAGRLVLPGNIQLSKQKRV